MALDWPLEPRRRELVSLEYSKHTRLHSNLPQAIAIAAGRWLGAGPLALLYRGRLANALLALIAARLKPYPVMRPRRRAVALTSLQM
jgi:hypothetical protein